MTEKRINIILNDQIRELLASTQHMIWSDWMKWMFTTGTFNEDGTWTMPVALVDRWHRQMTTHYNKLTETEKDSDRREADKTLRILETLSE